jgi:Zinc binding domain
MSRAFMKDPEPGDPRCPGCGGLGEPVGPTTMDAHLAAAARAPLGASAFYCADASCRTAYFNAWGAAVPADQVTGPAWPKDPEAPICPCFGMKAADVLADAREGRKERVKALVEKSRGPEARCATSAPDGVCCVPKVMRLFREAFDAR